jgi:hypothetical protein
MQTQNTPLAKFHNDIDGTRQYIIDEHNLGWILGVAKDMLNQDLKTFNGEPMEEAVVLNISRIQKTLDLIDEE